jgi:hypothetical protein
MISLTQENINRMQQAFGDLAVFDRLTSLPPLAAVNCCSGENSARGPVVVSAEDIHNDDDDAPPPQPHQPATAAHPQSIPVEVERALGPQKKHQQQPQQVAAKPFVDPCIISLSRASAAPPAPAAAASSATAFFDPAIIAAGNVADEQAPRESKSVLELFAFAGRGKGTAVISKPHAAPTTIPVAVAGPPSSAAWAAGIDDPAVISATAVVPFSPVTEAIERAAVCFTRGDDEDDDDDDIVVMRPSSLD